MKKDGKKGKKAKIVQVFGVNGSSLKELMVETTHKLYALEAWRTEFDQLTSIEKQWLVLTELYRIDKKGGGKLRRENVVEFDIFVELLGGKWRKHPETLPDLLDVDPVEIPVPEDDEDEGESVDLED